jgi:hypothetical protein
VNEASLISCILIIPKHREVRKRFLRNQRGIRASTDRAALPICFLALDASEEPKFLFRTDASVDSPLASVLAANHFGDERGGFGHNHVRRTHPNRSRLVGL